VKRYLLVFAVILLSGFLSGIYFVGTPRLRAYRSSYKNVHSGKQDKSGFKLPLGIQQMRIQTRKKEWKRDPFSISSMEEFKGEIHLEAISMGIDGKGIVMINGESYREGDILGSYKVKKIGKDYVIVDEGGENIMIKLEKGD